MAATVGNFIVARPRHHALVENTVTAYLVKYPHGQFSDLADILFG